MKILGVDPGTTKTAWIIFETEKFKILDFGINENLVVVESIISPSAKIDVMAIELIKSYGNVMGDSVIETCIWTGRFIQACPFPWVTIPRKTVVTELCHNPRAKDSNVRQAIIDLYRELYAIPNPKDVIGKKSSPGPLYGVTADVWSALAIVICYNRLRGRGIYDNFSKGQAI